MMSIGKTFRNLGLGAIAGWAGLEVLLNKVVKATVPESPPSCLVEKLTTISSESALPDGTAVFNTSYFVPPAELIPIPETIDLKLPKAGDTFCNQFDTASSALSPYGNRTNTVQTGIFVPAGEISPTPPLAERLGVPLRPQEFRQHLVL
jgi:hypothetical protein